MSTFEPALGQIETDSSYGWLPVSTPPTPGVLLNLRRSDGSVVAAVYDENGQRAVYLVRGTGGMFWRNIMGPAPVEWRYAEI